MNKRLSTIAMSLFLGMVLLASTVSNTYAQTPVNDGVVTLSDLGETEIGLKGPYDSSTATFGLPASWKFNGDAKINLDISASFNTSSLNGESAAFGGILTVSYNRSTVATLIIDKIGNLQYEITIPARLLASVRTDGLMELRFTLDGGGSCRADQNVNVIINPLTNITFTYEEQQPDTALINFPRPIFQSTIHPDLATVVIPDNPTAMELQSAYTVAAGFGNLSSNGLGLDLVTVSQLTDEQKAASHLVFVGKSASLPSLSELTLPLQPKSGAFTFADGGQDNGAIQMVNSPWAIENVVLVVSGNTDSGTLKAAQAVSTGIFQENTFPNLAIVENIQDTPAPQPLTADQTFADMGYSSTQITGRGIDSQLYNFYLPPSSTLSGDAYLDLSYGHSALLNYDTSGLVVLLNNQPIGSVKFTDDSAVQAINQIRVFIPASVAIPGDNRIEIRASLDPIDNCTDPNLRSLWAVIWPESKLHLPFTSAQFNTQIAMDLSAYPMPMAYDSTLSTTAIILQRNDIESWRPFIRVASYLGDRSNGAITRLSVFFDDELSSADLSKYNLIVVGRPSQLKIMDELNAALPVPFEKGSDITQGQFLQVTYQIPPEAPIGYVELMPSPWNDEKVLIAVFGNTAVGVNWGISALADSILRSQLAGDFAVINNSRIQTVDTRLLLPSIFITPASQDPSVIATGLPETTPSTQDNRQGWLLPALALVIVLIVVVVLAVVISNFRKNRKNI